MDATYIEVGYGRVAIAAILILINISLSIAFQLGLTRSLFIASLRMVVQLSAIGYVLEWLFERENPLAILAIALVMVSVAGTAGVNRTKRRFKGVYWNSLISILLSASLVTSVMVAGVIRVDPWYDPQYLIPLLGMVLGNILNGISLGLDRFSDSLVTHQSQIETLLSLGANRWEAVRPEIREAMRTGMIPITNSMMVMGLVSLPGMMTGQILAGAAPLDAVGYQIAIMFAIASATALGTFGVVLLGFFALTHPSHRLQLERLHRAKS